MTAVAPRLPRVAATLAVVALALAPAGTPAAEAAKPPKRIVALTPFTANTLAYLGVKPVAIGQTLGGRERFASSLKRARVLPLAHPNGPNMEQLAALEPQLVFSSPTWAKGEQTMKRLKMRVERGDPYRLAGPRPGDAPDRAHRRQGEGRQEARSQAGPRDQGVDPRHRQAPEGAAGAGRRAHAVRLPAQQLGRRAGRARGRQAADRRRQGRRRLRAHLRREGLRRRRPT